MRMDYGTGHETNLAIFMFCCCKAGIFNVQEDLRALILNAFNAYMITMRQLQDVYMLEPAGSHGVWGLDDYQCLVFLFGAAQVSLHPYVNP